MANVLSADDVVRQVKWVRNELASLFVERHPSYLQVAGCTGRPAMLNLPTAVIPESTLDVYRAGRLLDNLRQLLVIALQLKDTLDIKSKEYRKVSNLFQRRSPFYSKDDRQDKLYTRDEVRALLTKLRKRYGRRYR